MDANNALQVEETLDMQMTRTAMIVCLTTAFVASICQYFGGNLLWWMIAGWIISGPIVLIDAYFRKDERAIKGRSTVDAVTKPSVSTAHVKANKFARSHEDDADILR